MISQVFKNRIDNTYDIDKLYLEASILVRLLGDSLKRNELNDLLEDIEKLRYILERLILLD